MKKSNKIVSLFTSCSAAFLMALGGCAIDNPIDYTTGGAVSPGSDGVEDSGIQASSWTGTTFIGSTANEAAWRIEINAENEVYVAGYTDSSDDAEYGAGYNFLVKKFGNDSSEVWSKNWGSNSNDYLRGLGIDSQSNIYVAGFLKGAIADEGVGYNGGSEDIYYAKLDNSGQIQFSENYGVNGGGAEVGQFVEVVNDQIYVAGSAGNISSDSFRGWADTFLRKYDQNSNTQWTRQLGSSAYDHVGSIAADTAGNIYIAGRSESTNFNGGSNSRDDIFVAKYSSDSTLSWYKTFGTGSSQEWADGVATDENDNVYVFGFTMGHLDGANAGGKDVFIRKYDSAGNVLWTKQTGTSSDDWVGQGKVYNNKLYITGTTQGQMGDSSFGSNDGILLVYDLDGNQEQIIQWGSDQSDSAGDLAFDSSGNLLVVGTTAGSFDNQTNQGSNDIYIKQFTLAEISGVSTSDNTPPTAVSVVIDGGADNTTSSSVTLTLSATDDQAVTNYYASESAVTPQAGDSGWDNYSTSVSYSFDNDTAETKTVNVWFKDAAGNVSGSVVDTIQLQGSSSLGTTSERMSSGSYHTCTIKLDGSLQCWGSDSNGQSTVPIGLGSVKSVSAGGSHTCTIKADDSVQCWGDNSYQQSSVPIGLGSVKSVNAGGYHTCAIKADDSVQCWGGLWGFNYGQSTVPSGLGSVKSVTGGLFHSCAIKADDSVQCWGRNNWLQSSVPSGLGSVKSLSGEGWNTCAIKADDSVQCWGGDFGQSTVPSGLGSAKSVSAGGWHSCAIKADDSAQCWGRDGNGQSSVPGGLGNVKSIHAGFNHTCAIKNDDTVECWGHDGDGQSSVPAELQ